MFIANRWDDRKKSRESYHASENGLIYRPLSRTFAKADAEAWKRIPEKEYIWYIEASTIRLHSIVALYVKILKLVHACYQLHSRGKWPFRRILFRTVSFEQYRRNYHHKATECFNQFSQIYLSSIWTIRMPLIAIIFGIEKFDGFPFSRIF